MDCKECKWRHPETCRICRIEQEEARLKESSKDSIDHICNTVELKPLKTEPNCMIFYLN